MKISPSRKVMKTTTSSPIRNKSASQLNKDWNTAKKKLERKITTEKNRQNKTKLELYQAFFLNHSIDRKGVIKVKSLVRPTSNVYCGSIEIK